MNSAIRVTAAVLVSTLLWVVLSAAICADELDQIHQAVRPSPGLSLHKEMFMLPLTYSDEYDGEQVEAVFQLSAKHRIFGTHLYFAYTQISFWQAYDHNNSAPFRETNYNPEIFFRTSSSPLWSGRVGADIGAEHDRTARGRRFREAGIFCMCPLTTHAQTSSSISSCAIVYLRRTRSFLRMRR